MLILLKILYAVRPGASHQSGKLGAEGLTLSAKKIRGHSVKFTIRTNADGTATVLADVKARGFVIIIQ